MSDHTLVQRPGRDHCGEDAGGERDQDRYDLGILFVHGIGSQARGETLVRLGNALVTWLQRWIGGPGTGPEIRPRWILPLRERRGRSQDHVARSCRAALAEASLVEEPADPNRPATAELEVRLPDQDGHLVDSRWLLSESHWADEFLPPSFLDLCRWGFIVVPWTLASHLGGQVRRSWKAMRRRSAPRALLVASGEIPRMILLLCLVPLAASAGMVVVLLLLLLALLPVPWLRRWLGGAQRALAGTIGDSLVLLESPVLAAAIVSRTARDIRWMVPRCRRIAIVAHSQGAAIACEALATRVLAGRDPKDYLLFTFGSGLSKLEGLRWFRDNRPAWWVALAPAGLVLVGMSFLVPFWADPEAILSSEIVTRGYFLYAGFAAFFLAARAAVSGAVLDPGKLDPVKRFGIALRWCDRWASADPVPNGPLFDPDQTPAYVSSCDDANHGAVLTDHTSYHRNPEGFTAALAAELTRMAGLHLVLRPGDHERRRLGWHRRRFRVRCAVVVRRVAYLGLVAAPVILAVAERLDALGDSLGNRLGALAIRSPEWLANVFAPLVNLSSTAHGVIASTLAIGLLYGIIAGAWRIWDWFDVHDYFWRRDYGLGPGMFVWGVVVMYVATLVLSSTMLWLHPEFWEEEIGLQIDHFLLTCLLSLLLIEGSPYLIRFVRRRKEGTGRNRDHSVAAKTALSFVARCFFLLVLVLLWMAPVPWLLRTWLPGEDQRAALPWSALAIVAGVVVAIVTIVIVRPIEKRVARRAAVGYPREALAALEPEAFSLKEATGPLLEVLRPPDPPGSAEPAG